MSAKYGAPKKDDPRVFKVSVMVTATELEMIDIHRGKLTRSSFGRWCILTYIPQKEGAKYDDE